MKSIHDRVIHEIQKVYAILREGSFLYNKNVDVEN